MAGANIVSVSWGDHLKFGNGDGRLETPDAVARRMAAWKRELDAGQVLWRTLRQAPRRIQRGRDLAPPTKPVAPIGWDELALVPDLARDAGIEAYLYVTIFDEGWPLAPPARRARSHHNPFHARDVASQTLFSHAHPEYACVDRAGRRRHWGVLSLAYPAVRRYFRERYLALLDSSRFDGLFLCLRSQSRPPDHADQFGYNEPVRADCLAAFGEDIRNTAFDRPAWHRVQGGYLTAFLRELRAELTGRGVKLALGVPRGDIIGPPLGNWTLDWRTWVADGLVDQLIIDQNASKCPSMWLDLWPMRRGGGYLQNHLTGDGMPDLEPHVGRDYYPVIAGSDCALFLARQWHDRDARLERKLGNLESVSGLVFSSFRHDNARLLASGDWQD